MKYYIVFFDDSVKEVDLDTYEQILNESGSNAIGKEIGGSFYKFSDIRKILNERDFKEQYPSKSGGAYQPYSEIPAKGLHGILEDAKRDKMISAFLRGFLKTNPNPQNLKAKMLLEKCRAIVDKQ